MNRALLFASLSVVTFAGCNCTENPLNPVDGGSGGGVAVGGGTGTGTGGGSAVGGGAATGGGSATGGGAAMGGGSAVGGGTGTDVDAGMDAGSTVDAGTDAGVIVTDGGVTCVFTPSSPNALRKVVVSHPFPDDGGTRDNRYEVFDLTSSGMLTANGPQFRMGRSSDYSSPIVFTPDGRIGFVTQEQGTIGVFRFDEGGVVVVHAAFVTGFSPGKLIFLPATSQLLATDFNTQNNGGGLYSIDVGCDGSLSNVRLVLAGNNASAELRLKSTNTTLVASRSLGTSPMMQDLHVVDIASLTAAAVTTSTTGFPDRDAIPPSISASRDLRVIALPDNGFLAGSRIAFFELNGSTVTSRAVVTTPNPAGVAFSPFGDVGLVVNTDGADHYRRLTWDSALTTFTIGGALTYVHGRPQLPTVPVMIDRGLLEGRVLIGELDAIRQLQFETDGGITDVSSTPVSGTGSAQIVGTFGVTP